MEKEIKDKTFSFKLAIILDNTVEKHLNKWVNLINKQKERNNDNWTTIPELPYYQFKNLKLINNKTETNDDNIYLNVRFRYDEVMLII